MNLRYVLNIICYNANMDIKNCKLVFLGTPMIAAQVLIKLIAINSNIVAVLTQPTKPFGRGLKLTTSEVERVARVNNLPLYKPESAVEIEKTLVDLKPDILVVVAYGHILSKRSLASAKLGAVNVHGSLLPKYRGPSPIQTTILEGDKVAGITFLKMTKKMDAGPILLKKSIPVKADETSRSLTDKLTTLACDEIEETLVNYLNGNIRLKEQENESATFCHLISKNDGLICWESSATKIHRQIRAYNPWPMAFTYWEKEKLIILSSATTKLKLSPGQVRLINGQLLVGTSTTALELLSLKPAGKKIMTAQDFMNGHLQIDNYIF